MDDSLPGHFPVTRGIYPRMYADRPWTFRQYAENTAKMVEAKDGDEMAEIYMFSKGKEVGGLTIIASEKKELSVVNIVGPIDLKTLGSLGGKFGIPKDVGSTLPKPLSPPKSPDKKDD